MRVKEKVQWTYGDGDCAFNTKKEAKEDRKRNFGHLYASEAEMDRLIPLYKAVFAFNCYGEMGYMVKQTRETAVKEAIIEALGTMKEHCVGDMKLNYTDCVKINGTDKWHKNGFSVDIDCFSDNDYLFNLRAEWDGDAEMRIESEDLSENTIDKIAKCFSERIIELMSRKDYRAIVKKYRKE